MDLRAPSTNVAGEGMAAEVWSFLVDASLPPFPTTQQTPQGVGNTAVYYRTMLNEASNAKAKQLHLHLQKFKWLIQRECKEEVAW